MRHPASVDLRRDTSDTSPPPFDLPAGRTWPKPASSRCPEVELAGWRITCLKTTNHVRNRDRFATLSHSFTEIAQQNALWLLYVDLSLPFSSSSRASSYLFFFLHMRFASRSLFTLLFTFSFLISLQNSVSLPHFIHHTPLHRKTLERLLS